MTFDSKYNFRIYNKREFIKYMYEHYECFSEVCADFKYLLTDLMPKTSKYLVTFDEETKEPVGLIQLNVNPYEDNCYWVIFCSVKPSYRNMGVASNMLKYLFKYARQEKFNLEGSSYTKMGERFVKPVIDKLKSLFTDVVFVDSPYGTI